MWGGLEQFGIGILPTEPAAFPLTSRGIGWEVSLGKGAWKIQEKRIGNPRKRGLETPVGLLKSRCSSWGKRALEQGSLPK